MNRTHKPSRAGFTLIELLVVVTIIALLIAILLPSLSNAKKVARTAVCGTQLRAMAMTMTLYAETWDDKILGNPFTSSVKLTTGSFPNYSANPALNDNNLSGRTCGSDYETPMAEIMNIHFDPNATSAAARGQRFAALAGMKQFNCPENDIIAQPFTGQGGPNMGAHRMPSYNTPIMFNFREGNNNGFTEYQSAWATSGSFNFKRGSVGMASAKIFIADGGRWYNGSAAPVNITTNLAIYNGNGSGSSPGGVFSDWGPWNLNTRAYNRGTGDGRTVSMRHGIAAKNAPLAAYKMNAAFFDAHVELLDGAAASNPALWAPSGATISNAEPYTDIKTIYWGAVSTLSIP